MNATNATNAITRRIKFDESGKLVGLTYNEFRTGWLIENASNSEMYALFQDDVCSKNNRSIKIEAGVLYEPPDFLAKYKGVITIAGVDKDGHANITEITKEGKNG